MRWERLFADIEGQFDAAEAAELAAEVNDRTRREFSRLRLSDRLRGSLGAVVSVGLPTGDTVRGLLTGVGPDWLLLDGQRDVPGSAAREVVVPLDAAVTVSGLGPQSGEPGLEGAVAARLGLRYVMGRLARSRVDVAVTSGDGRRLVGRLERVGADFVEVSLRDNDQVVTIPLRSIVVIRSV